MTEGDDRCVALLLWPGCSGLTVFLTVFPPNFVDLTGASKEFLGHVPPDFMMGHLGIRITIWYANPFIFPY
jgi:hypothetical protein